MVTIEKYREILNDRTSSDSQIKECLQYLEAFCKNVIDMEIENYININKNVKEKNSRI